MHREITVSDRITAVFEKNVVRKEGCWGWAYKPPGQGYPSVCGFKASRYSYVLHKGEIPEGLFVCHRCDNPECTNPEHLFLGTQKDNMLDASAKGRLGGARKTKAPKLTNEERKAIREPYREQYRRELKTCTAKR